MTDSNPTDSNPTDSQTLTMPDGRTVGYATFGAPDGRAVLWCHGGPGSRYEAASLGPAAVDAGLRIVGIDRPGYGLSTPWPGRSIADWVPDGLAVADQLGIDRFATVGCSTGGAYALALGALAPDRVAEVVACCALTDMRWPEGRAMMDGAETAGIWAAPDREAALAVAVASFGEDGSQLMARAGDDDGPGLAEADLALFSDPTWLASMMEGLPQMFTFGVQGYADDRIADGAGWASFDVSTIRCPVAVVHGGSDSIVPVAHARHTAEIVPGATLRVVEPLGHFSIVSEVIPALVRSA